MKRLVVILCAVVALFWACSDKENVVPTTVTKSSISKQIDNVTLTTSVEVKNGRLKVNDLKDFLILMNELSDQPSKHYSRKALNDWENKIGFTSLRQKHETLMQEYDVLDSEEKQNNFKSEHQDVLNGMGNRVPEPKISGVLGWVLDSKHSVYIGTSLNLFINDKQIVILDGDETKISKAIRAKVSIPEEKIYVHQFIDKPNTGERASCIKSAFRECNGSSSYDDYWIKEKSVYGNWQIQKYISYTNFNDPSTQFIYPQFSAYIKSERRHRWYGWAKNHVDNINWNVSYSINTWRSSQPWLNTAPPLNIQFLGSATHGTGWTQNSAEISYAKSFLTELPINTYNSVPYAYAYFGFNDNDVTNNDLPACNCQNDCN